MANGSNSPVPQGPWREGRPSFKAYYPEIILLGFITIAGIALGFKWSCSAVKQTSAANSACAPAQLPKDAPFLTTAAFAQDASIDEVVNDEEALESVEETLDADEAASVEDASSDESADALETATEEAQTEEYQSPATDEPAVPTSAPKGSKTLYLVFIWCVCLGVPLILWMWRGWHWISVVYGTKYELRCDPDNLRATTFLITRGILHRSTNSMHIGQIKDVRSEQTLIEKYLLGGVGTIILFTSDQTDPEVKMKHMAEPSRVFNAFDELRRVYWARGGVQFSGGGEVASDEGDIVT